MSMMVTCRSRGWDARHLGSCAQRTRLSRGSLWGTLLMPLPFVILRKHPSLSVSLSSPLLSSPLLSSPLLSSPLLSSPLLSSPLLSSPSPLLSSPQKVPECLFPVEMHSAHTSLSERRLHSKVDRGLLKNVPVSSDHSQCLIRKTLSCP